MKKAKPRAELYRPKKFDKPKRDKFDFDKVQALSIAVYKMRLVDGGGPGAVERMIADDGDNGEKLSMRAHAYDALTRCYLQALKQQESKE